MQGPLKEGAHLGEIVNLPTVIREDGWYWVQIPGWGENEWREWTPALWSEASRSWSSALFFGYPDYQVRVGERLIKGPSEEKDG